MKNQTTTQKIGVFFTVYGAFVFTLGVFVGVEFVQVGLLAMILGEVIKN